MGFPKLNTLIIIAAGVLALASCKKDKEEEVLPSLSGILTFSLDAYVSPDDEVSLTPKGVTHPDGGEVGYYWKVTPGMEEAETTEVFTHKFKDSLATYTISCTAYAKGYSSSYSTKYATVVKPGFDGSITETGITESDRHISVEYPGNKTIKYYYTTVNGLDWMRNNLANPEYGAPFDNCEAMSEIFGRYYSYEEAEIACPEGWTLPTDQQWRDLAATVTGKDAAGANENIKGIAASLMVDGLFNLNEMWEYWPEVGTVTNASELSILPTGYANLGSKAGDKYPTASFQGLYEYAMYWTADADGQGMAFYRYLIMDQPDMFIEQGDIETFGASVRCVRQAE